MVSNHEAFGGGAAARAAPCRGKAVSEMPNERAKRMTFLRPAEVKAAIQKAVKAAPVVDMHTHLYDPSFGGLLLRGIDELITYHYLIAESTRASGLAPAKFYAMPRKARAEFVWDELFVKRSPVSEAARGVLTTATAYGLDPRRDGLDGMRKFFKGLSPEKHVDLAFATAGVESAVMTNDPFNDAERASWERGGRGDERFQAALRIDPLVIDLPGASAKLRAWGCGVAADFSGASASELRRFCGDWIKRMNARYAAMSFTPDFAWPDASLRGRILGEAVIPACRDASVPFALMIGVRRRIRPELGDAGDGVGKGDPSSVGRLCAEFPDATFLCTMLAREDQHELCVTARKFSNLKVFGCWWFLNNPSLVREITAMRLELLGLTFVPQHSDARILDQVVYKWRHSKEVIADVLSAKYADMAKAGWRPARDEIDRDVEALFSGNARDWLRLDK